MKERANRLSTRNRLERFKRYIPIYIMAIPGIIYLFINNYLPMAGMVVAFKDYNVQKGIWGSEWNGIKNFIYLFKTKDAWNITRNTIAYNAVFIVLLTVISVGMAICLNEIKSKWYSRFCQTILLLPHLVSMVIVAYIVYAFLGEESGFLNHLLEKLGADQVMWYSTEKYWPYILTIVYLWKNVGYNVIVYYASIVGIDKSLYESADLDGATKFQQIMKITIPMILPTIILMTLLAIGRIFRSDFGLFYHVPMHSGPIQDVTATIDTYVYNGLMKLGDVGMSSAASLYQSVVGFVLILASNWIIRKRRPDDSLF